MLLMSFDYNYKFWVATRKELDDLLKRQEVIKELKPVDDPAAQHLLFAELYARYVNLVNKLGYIYHYTFQVQKRPLVKNLVEAATTRLLELKEELKKLEFCEFTYIDKTLIERRLTPDDIIVWTPEYFPYWRPINIHELIHGPRKTIEEDQPPPTTTQPTDDEGAADADETIKTDNPNETDKSTIKVVNKQSSRRVQMTRNRIKIPLKLRKDYVDEEEEAMDPEKRALKNAATCIQSHERARVARRLYKHIQTDPDHFRPKAREDSAVVGYKFTHKPSQSMLIPIKRTHFRAKYYMPCTDSKTFQYYVQPVFIEESKLSGYLSDSEDSNFGEEERAEEMSAPEEEGSEGDEMSEYETESMTAMALEEMVKKMINDAATKIQTYWRGSRERQNYKGLLLHKMQILGMADEYRPNRLARKRRFDERMKSSMKNRLRKDRHDEALVKFCEDDRARILRVRGPWIMEDISDGIRAWFKEFYDVAGAFHPYPSEAKGGTLLLLKGETMDVYEFERKKGQPKMTKEEKKALKEKEKEKKKKEKEKKKKLERAKAKRREELKKRGIVDFKDEMERSKAVRTIEETVAKYKKEWADIDEKLNVSEDIIKEWVTSDHYAEIHKELQVTVDEMMRLEYALLERALAKDNGKRHKRKRHKKRKEHKKHKKHKKHKRHKSRERRHKKHHHDPTGHRSVESLYYELQDNKIAKLFPQKTYEDYLGDRNLCAYDFLNILMKYVPPCAGEMTDILPEYVLGMGPLEIHKPKGILLAGPKHCGKQLMCHILASEIDAVVLDISPENIGAYHKNMSHFCHIIVKVAKLLQPTIIYIHNIDRVFAKRAPHHMDYNPRVLQHWLKSHIMKPLDHEDRVFLLATTDAPWTARGTMKSLFQKILLVPKTEYADSFILRRNATLQKFGVPRNFSFTALATVTKDYTTGDIIQNINETLNLKRRMVLPERPLQQMEFLDNLLDQDPPKLPLDHKEWLKYTKWYRKVSKMEKKRIKMMNERMKEAEDAKSKKKGKKKAAK